ncbi:elongation factor [Rhynchospora pubera]|uniref:Elongation factor n=1 Tax=Rhynchospora pubera TaxID=906938 RepID=A0AAV8D5V6_9POAL|nr:elongation factor [Rhynchospora pubera]
MEINLYFGRLDELQFSGDINYSNLKQAPACSERITDSSFSLHLSLSCNYRLFRMGWWSRVVYPIRRVFIGVASGLGIHKSGRRGLGRLRHEVITCEYEDVRVMWEMLSRREDTWIAPIEPHQHEMDRKSSATLGVFSWPRRWAAFHLCRSF